MRVLHVAEAWGGGVQQVVGRYIAATPELEHRVLVRPRPEAAPAEVPVDVEEVAGSLTRFLSVTADRIRRERPDVVHLHSSWAGLLRFAPTAARLVYTPHAYAFLREDVGLARTLTFLAAERLLSARGLVAGCSPYECVRARALGARTVYLPPPVAWTPPIAEPGGPVSVVMVGRVCTQKDPGFFAQVARIASRDLPGVDFRWIGGGDAALSRVLADAGVEVTGWVSPHQVRDQLTSRPCLYLHTARWEGTPLTLVDAAGLGTPILLRRRPYATGFGLGDAGDSVGSAVAAVIAAVTDAETRARLIQQSVEFGRRHTQERTRAALVAAYAL